jgi:hypothetical protein
MLKRVAQLVALTLWGCSSDAGSDADIHAGDADSTVDACVHFDEAATCCEGTYSSRPSTNRCGAPCTISISCNQGRSSEDADDCFFSGGGCFPDTGVVDLGVDTGIVDTGLVDDGDASRDAEDAGDSDVRAD